MPKAPATACFAGSLSVKAFSGASLTASTAPSTISFGTSTIFSRLTDRIFHLFLIRIKGF